MLICPLFVLSALFALAYQMPNPFLISILTLITILATAPTIANTNLNTPNKTTTIVGSNLQANAMLAVASAGVSGDAATQTT
jgi:hypothetical protein